LSPQPRPAPVDFGRSADDYARFRGGFPPALFDRLEAAFAVERPGRRLLDVGTGTGALAREFARRGWLVTATDPSADLLAQAREQDIEACIEVAYLQHPAEHSELPTASFDVVTAGRCWHWFDRAAAAAEIRRLLVPAGILAIAHFDRVVVAPGSVLETTQKLVERWNPDWAKSPPMTFGGGVGLYPDWVRDLARAGFRDIETFSFDVTVGYTHESWRGRVRSGGGVGPSLCAEQVAALDAELDALLKREFPAEPLLVTHRAFATLGRSPRLQGRETQAELGGQLAARQ